MASESEGSSTTPTHDPRPLFTSTGNSQLARLLTAPSDNNSGAQSGVHSSELGSDIDVNLQINTLLSAMLAQRFLAEIPGAQPVDVSPPSTAPSVPPSTASAGAPPSTRTSIVITSLAGAPGETDVYILDNSYASVRIVQRRRNDPASFTAFVVDTVFDAVFYLALGLALLVAKFGSLFGPNRG